MSLWKTGLFTVTIISLTACASAKKVADQAKDQVQAEAETAATDAAEEVKEAAEETAGDVETGVVADKLGAYLAGINGTNKWDVVEPLFNAVMHDDVVVVTADGELDKAAWATSVQGMLDKGAASSDFEVSKKEGDAFWYSVKITMGDKVMEAASKATVKDGMLARVEPVDPEVYSKLKEGGDAS